MNHKTITKTTGKPFWEKKKLHEMSEEEWESLCDGCSKCCLHKVESEDTGDVHYTSLACKLLDLGTCQCTDYAQRHQKVPDCVKLTPKRIGEFKFLPETCAYRIISEKKSLPAWHPLQSGSPKTVHDEGISVMRFAKHPDQDDVIEHHLIDL